MNGYVTDVLKPMFFDLHKKANSEKHHTDDYTGHEQLIVRRGESFTFSVTFQRPFSKETDFVTVLLSFGEFFDK